MLMAGAVVSQKAGQVLSGWIGAVVTTAQPPIADTQTLRHIQSMIKFLPILLILGYAALVYWFSAFRTKAELDQRSTLLADGRLKALCDRFASAVGVDQIKVHIYEIAPVNGLAAPDGRIFITRGFYNKYRTGEVTAEEMASVIAHELGHVALGHARKRMIDFSGTNAVRIALATIFNRFLPGLGVLIANALVSLLAAKLSRNDEYEADAYASALMVKAGLGTEPQKSLFRKLNTLTGMGGGIPAWLMSHPSTEDRIQAIEQNEARWKLAPKP
jgi:metalloprotease